MKRTAFFFLIIFLFTSLISLPLPFLSKQPEKSLFQYESKYNKIKLTDFSRLSDFGYGLNANVYFGGQINHSSGYGNYHLAAVWRNIDRSFTMSSKFDADLEHNIPATLEFRIEEYRIELDITGDAGPESDMGIITFDKYINKKIFKKPVFVFAEPQMKFIANQDTLIEPTIAIFAGIGIGKIFPSAEYNRVGDFLKILEENDLLIREITYHETNILMSIIKNNWQGYKETDLALKKMEESGLLKEFPSRAIFDSLVNSIRESQPYMETGSDARFGINYNFTTGETVYMGVQSDDDEEKKDEPLRVSFTYRESYQKKPFVITPWLSLFQELKPDIITFANLGTEIIYQFSPRLKPFMKDKFTFYSGEKYTSFSNNLRVGTYYDIVSLLGACLVGEVDVKTDYRPKFSIQFNLGIGMLDL
ncbi:MAG: hypothetical protein K8R49_05875 [Candidatus Cloacimonetes bacterium]|nr:hypothetical protein [Candidatus Cloacimonadota bacterium]